MAGWATTALFPFNPERVLRHAPKPLTELTAPNANEAVSCPQEQVLQILMTPVTPATTEALTWLHSIVKRGLHEPSKDRVQRHILKAFLPVMEDQRQRSDRSSV